MGLSKKRTAILSLLLLVSVLLFSSIYVARESTHECHGEDCPVCAVIQLCLTVTRSVGAAAPFFAASLSFFAAVLLFVAAVSEHTVSITPVSQKIKLLN